MNLKNILFPVGVALWSVGALSGCSSGGGSGSEEPTPSPGPSGGEETYEISVTPTSYTFLAEGETAEFTVMCDGEWMVIPDGWFQFEPASGKGNTKILVTAEANLSEIEYVSVVKIVSQSDNQAEITLTQPPVEPLPEVVMTTRSEYLVSGDAAGVFMVNRQEDGTSVPLPDLSSNPVNNAQFLMDDNGGWITRDPVYWSDTHTAADAYFYYPWSAPSGNDPSAWSFSAAVDQTDQDRYRKSCVLHGYVENVEPGQVLSFEPKVLSSNIQAKIVLDEKVKDRYTVVGVTFGELCTEGMLDLNAGMLTASGQRTNIRGYLTADDVSGWNASVIVPAQTVDQLLITVEYRDRTQTEILSREFVIQNVSLQPGLSQSFSLTLNEEKDPVLITDVTTLPWGEGGSFDLDFE